MADTRVSGKSVCPRGRDSSTQFDSPGVAGSTIWAEPQLRIRLRLRRQFVEGQVGVVAMGPFAVIFPAAGKSSRFGDPKQKKIYAELDGRAVWLRAVEPFVNRDDVGQMILAIAPRIASCSSAATAPASPS